MTRQLENKTAFVTGGSRGIGREIAKRLAADGAVVGLTYNTSPEGADETVAAIEDAGGRAFALHADLADAGAIPSLFSAFDEQLSDMTGATKLDILVNTAGSSGFGGLTDSDQDAFDHMFATHTRAPFFMIKSAIDRMGEGGRIINFSSGLSTRPNPAASIYSMAKASVNVMTHVLAMELGPKGITVNAVAPGWTRTDMNAAVRENADMVKAIEADTALGRFGETDDIAPVVAFLASDEGRWVTGQVIEASGGYDL
ncbi:short-chain dehydrogenase [Erythrobacter sp. HI00D59]|nr:short-chain dehydrogenase [Erythrobacter sp. HI00D59]